MRWFLTVRRAWPVLGWASALSLVVLLLGARELPVPSLVGGGLLAVPLAFLLPAAQAALVVGVVGEPLRAAERSAVRSVLVLDTALLAALVVTVAGPLVLVGALVDEPLLVAAGRNIVGFCGVGLLTWPIVGGRGAAAAPVLVSVLLAAFAGRHREAVWAWPMHPPGSPEASVAAVLLLIAGFAVLQGFRQRGMR